jgi:putative FmdB family regulatory protein
MALYTYKCQMCPTTVELVARFEDDVKPCPNCTTTIKNGDIVLGTTPSLMKRVLSVPSPAQWNCRKPS